MLSQPKLGAEATERESLVLVQPSFTRVFFQCPYNELLCKSLASSRHVEILRNKTTFFLGINKEFCFLSFKQKEGLLFKFIEFYDFKIMCCTILSFFNLYGICPHRFRVFNLPNLSLMLYFNT